MTNAAHPATRRGRGPWTARFAPQLGSRQSIVEPPAAAERLGLAPHPPFPSTANRAEEKETSVMRIPWTRSVGASLLGLALLAGAGPARAKDAPAVLDSRQMAARIDLHI